MCRHKIRKVEKNGSYRNRIGKGGNLKCLCLKTTDDKYKANLASQQGALKITGITN